MRKNVGLVLSIAILLILAVFSPKKILVSKGFSVTPEQFADGREVYDHSCRECHASGRHGAPRIDDRAEWRERLKKGIDRLVVNAADGCLAGDSLPEEGVALATAYMIATSRGKNNRRGGQSKAAL